MVTVCHAAKLPLQSIEAPFFRPLYEHFFALQTIFGVLHVRCGNVCLKTRFIPPFHVQQKKRWIIRALGPVVNLASFFIETWHCDLCDDLFHRFDCVSVSVELRGDNVRMQTHKFGGHTQTKRRLGSLSKFTEREKTFLCMDLSQRTRSQNR